MIRGAAFLRWTGMVFLILSLFEPFSAMPAGAEAEPPPPPGDIELSLDGTPAPSPTEPVFVPTETPEPTAEPTQDVAPEPIIEPTEAPLPSIEPTATTPPTMAPTEVPATSLSAEPSTEMGIAAAAGLNVTIAADAVDVYWNDTIGLTITLTNTGNSDINELVLRGPIIPTSWSIGESPAAAACLIADAGLICDFTLHGDDILPLPGGASIVLYVSGITPGCHGRHFEAEADWDGGTTTANFASVLVNCERFTISTEPESAVISAGDEISFTVRAAREYSGVVNFTMALPDAPGMTWTYDKIGHCAFGSEALFTLGCYPNVASHIPFEVTVTSPTTTESCGTYDVMADAYYPFDKLSNTATVTVVCPSNVEITKIAEPEIVTPGEPIGFTITLSNVVYSAAFDVGFTDQLPAVPGQQWTFEGNTPDECAIDASGLLSCAGIDLPASASEFSVHVRSETLTDGTTCGAFTSTVELDAPSIGNDTATATVACASAFVTDFMLESNEVKFGDDIQFIQTTTNTGSANDDNVAISVTLPQLETVLGLVWTTSVAPLANGTCTAGATDENTSMDCTGVSLGIGDSFVIEFTSTITAAQCGVLDFGDWGIVTVTCPSIAVSIEAVNAEVMAGDEIGFKVTIAKAASEGILTNWWITLPGAEGMNWASSPSGCNPSQVVPNQMDCRLVTVQRPATSIIMVASPTTGASCGTYSTFATVEAWPEDALSNTVTVTVLCPEPEPEPNVEISTVADAETINYGERPGFTITVTNTGDAPATGVAFESMSSGGRLWTMSASLEQCSFPGSLLTCTGIDLEPGEEFTVHIYHIYSAWTRSCGQALESTATLTAGGTGSATASIYVICPELAITIVPDVNQVIAGEDISFTVTVTNASAFDAVDTRFRAILPQAPGLLWSLSSVGQGPDLLGACSVSTSSVGPDELDCTMYDFGPERSFVVQVSSPTTVESCGTHHASALLRHPGLPMQTDPMAISVLCPEPDVSITKVADAAEINYGEQPGFTITVKNNGTDPVSGVTFEDPLPFMGGLFWRISPTVDECELGERALLSCTGIDLAPGEALEVHVHHRSLSFEGCGMTLESTATLTAGGTGAAIASIDVVCPELAITIIPDADEVIPGEAVGVTIRISNHSDFGSYLTNAMIGLPNISGMTWSAPDFSCRLEEHPGENWLDCSERWLTHHSSYEIRVTIPAPVESCGPHTLTGVLQYGGPSISAEPATITVLCPEPEPNVEITKVADAETVNYRQDMGFTITVTNNGDAPATGIAFEDPLLSSPLWFWVSTPVHPECNEDSSFNTKLTCTGINLEPGEEFIIHLKYPRFPRCDETVESTARLTAGGEGSATASVYAVCPDPVITVELDNDVVIAGDNIGLTITYANLFPGDYGFYYDLPERAISGIGFGRIYCVSELDTCIFNASGDYPTSRTDYLVGSTRSHGCGTHTFGAVTYRPVHREAEPVTLTILCPEPDITITNSIEPAAGRIGDEVTFTYEIANTGNVPLSDVTVTNSLFGDAILDCAVASLPVEDDSDDHTYTCTATYTIAADDVVDGQVVSGASVSSAFRDMPANGSSESVFIDVIPIAIPEIPTITQAACADPGHTAPNIVTVDTDGITYTLDPASGWAAGDTVSVTATLADDYGWPLATPAGWTPVPDVPNQLTRTIELETPDCPSLALDMTASPLNGGTVREGDLITYTLTVNNPGNLPLTDVMVDSDLINLVWEDAFTGGSVGDLEPNTSAVVTATYTVTASDVAKGDVSHEALAQGASADNGGAVLRTQPRAVAHPVTQSPSIGLEVAADLQAPTDNVPLGSITSTYTVTNTGDSTLTGITIADPLLDDGPISVGDLAPGRETTVSGTHTIVQADVDAGVVNSEATVEGIPPVGLAVSDSDSTSTTIPQHPGLALTKQVTGVTTLGSKERDIDPAEPVIGLQAGDVVSYTLVATNTGNVTLTDVTITDTMLQDFVCDEVTTLGPTASISCSGTYTVTQADIDAGNITNAASVTATAPNDAEVTDTASVSIPLAQEPAMAIVMMANVEEAVEGDEITLTFEVTNTGNVTIRDLTITNTLTDLVWDIGATARTGILSFAQVNADGAVGDLAPGDSRTISATYTVTSADVHRGEISSTAFVTGNGPRGEIAATSALVTIVVAQSTPEPAPNPTSTPAPDTTPVPAATPAPEPTVPPTPDVTPDPEDPEATVTGLPGTGSGANGTAVAGMLALLVAGLLATGGLLASRQRR